MGHPFISNAVKGIQGGRALLILFVALFFAPALHAEEAPFNPYTEEFPEGRIDWDKGLVYGIGKGYLHLNKGSRAHALRAARALALQSILKVAAGVRLDDRETLESLGASGRVEIRLSGLVRHEEHETSMQKDGDRDYVRVTYRAPLRGIEGLTRKLIVELRKKPSAWETFPAKRPGGKAASPEGLPWLVVDARGLPSGASVKPALFPRIHSDGGGPVYALDRVYETALIERGMARYVVLDPAHDRLLSSAPGFLARLCSFFSTPRAWAQNAKKRRGSGGYVVVNARNAEGLKKTNLVISKEDAQRIQQEDASSDMLKECRVIVVVSGTLGGIEGRLEPQPGPLGGEDVASTLSGRGGRL